MTDVGIKIDDDGIYETGVEATGSSIDGVVDDIYDGVGDESAYDGVGDGVYDGVGDGVYDGVGDGVYEGVGEDVDEAVGDIGEETDRRPALFTLEKSTEEVAEEFQRLQAFDPNQTR